MAQHKDFLSPFLSDYTKIFEDYKMQNFDLQGILETQRKNIQAFSEAQQSLLGNMQSIAQRHSEIISKAMQEQSKLTSELLREGKPDDKIAKNAELIKKNYEQAMSNFSEIAEMVKKANSEASGILNRRAKASMKEIKSVVDGALKNNKSAA